ncbi:MAG TPA: acyl-CoA dehydrogenase, partial [Rhodobacteraceae bacterium]|nr:acyl-CoA dehydrogenase [Paracoccaceae bacterium]
GMGRIWVGATCCGKAERILNMATDWAATRKQFGKPIGTFQATGFRLADGAINLRAADLLVNDAVARAEKGVMSDADA